MLKTYAMIFMYITSLINLEEFMSVITYLDSLFWYDLNAGYLS